MKYFRKIILFGLLCCMFCFVKANDSIAFNLNADIVSRYLWRGLIFSPNVNIQPYAGLSYKGFTFSTWASYGISDKYAEVDFSLSYNFKNLTLGLNDYYNEDENDLKKIHHFNFDEKTTSHLLEASLSCKISEKLPLTFSGACFFFGYDKDTSGNNNYSTYIEASYPFSYSDYSFNIFAGGTPNKGFYSDKASLTNLGFSALRNIKITGYYSLPLSLSLVSNPYAEDIFLILKFTF